MRLPSGDLRIGGGSKAFLLFLFHTFSGVTTKALTSE
jgi:hypothetical protein